jgi:methylthioribose-1-phosphate isomerase
VPILEQTTADLGILPIKIEGHSVFLVDQRILPAKFEYFQADDLETICFAIKDMVVRGAPSIGVAAAFGLAKDAVNFVERNSDCTLSSLLERLKLARQALDQTRPTAVNLTWATRTLFERALLAINGEGLKSPKELAFLLFEESQAMLANHIELNRRLSSHGAELLHPSINILTHCNAGSLAACGWGTALGVIRSAQLLGLNPHVYVDETRPRNQGSKLTAFELMRDKIACTVISDSSAGYLMAQGKIDCVITGADRIARNGDTANKIGTYSLAVLANAHNIPFYIAAPIFTIDPECESGSQIKIEERNPDELTTCGGINLAPDQVKALNLAFDVTPARFISGIITESGVLRMPYETAISKIFESKKAVSESAKA